MCIAANDGGHTAARSWLRYAFEKNRDGGFEFAGNIQQGGKGEVGFAAFDLTHVTAVDSTNISELFLRPAPLQTQLTDSRT